MASLTHALSAIAAALLASLATAGAAPPAAAADDVPVPAVRPITGGERGYPQGSFARRPSTIDLAAAGYVEQEYELSGTATACTQAGDLGNDGRWSVRPVATAPYRTRRSRAPATAT